MATASEESESVAKRRPRRRHSRRLDDAELAAHTAELSLAHRDYERAFADYESATRAREQVIRSAADAGMSLAQIGRVIGVSRARVDQIYNRAVSAAQDADTADGPATPPRGPSIRIRRR